MVVMTRAAAGSSSCVGEALDLASDVALLASFAAFGFALLRFFALPVTVVAVNGVLLSAGRRGHQGFSDANWKRAPPAEANTGDTDTSDFFIEIKPGFQFVVTDMHHKSACLPGTSIHESVVSALLLPSDEN